MEKCLARTQYQRPEIEKHGKRWTIRAWVPKLESDGSYKLRRQRITLGLIDEMKLTDAKKEADRILASINDGRFVAAAQMGFEAVLEKYMQTRLLTLGKATQEKYLSHIKNHLQPAFKGSRLADLDTSAIEAVLMNLKSKARVRDPETGKVAISQQPVSPNTRADVLHVLSAIFTTLKDWKWWTEENPCDRVKIGKIEAVREKRLLTAEEMQHFLAAIPDTRICSAEQARYIVITGAVAGCRPSETLGLQKRDLDPVNETLAIQRRFRRGELAGTKTRASRRVRKIGRLVHELLGLMPAGATDEDFVFQREGKMLDDRDLQQHAFRPAAEVCGIYYEGFGLHLMRALNVTLRQKFGASSIEAAKAAGHARPAVTALYTLEDLEREGQHVASILRWVSTSAQGVGNVLGNL